MGRRFPDNEARETCESHRGLVEFAGFLSQTNLVRLSLPISVENPSAS